MASLLILPQMKMVEALFVVKRIRLKRKNRRESKKRSAGLEAKKATSLISYLVPSLERLRVSFTRKAGLAQHLKQPFLYRECPIVRAL